MTDAKGRATPSRAALLRDKSRFRPPDHRKIAVLLQHGTALAIERLVAVYTVTFQQPVHEVERASDRYGNFAIISFLSALRAARVPTEDRGSCSGADRTGVRCYPHGSMSNLWGCVAVQHRTVVRPRPGLLDFRALMHCAAAAITLSIAGPAAAQVRVADGSVATPPEPDVAAAWYGRPTTRYAHGVLGDEIEGGSLVVRDERGAIHEIVLPERYVFEDVTPRLADLDGDGRREIVAIRTDVRAGAAVAVYGLSGEALVERAATPPIGQPNRWLSIAAIEDFTGDGRDEIAVVRTPHIGGVLELLSLRDGTLRRVYPPQPGYTSHTIGATEVSFAATADVSGDGVADLILPEQNRRRLLVLRLVDGVVPIAAVDLPARVAGPVEVDAGGFLHVPLEIGGSVRVDLR